MHFILSALWLMSMMIVLLAPESLGWSDAGEGRIRGTIRISLIYWFVAVMGMLRVSRANWRQGLGLKPVRFSRSVIVAILDRVICAKGPHHAEQDGYDQFDRDTNLETKLLSLIRAAWTWSWLAFVIHVVVAFHFAHHWSHVDVVRHTEAQSGFGEGVFISYAFTLLWTVDVGWWWLDPRGYQRRPLWLGGIWQGFMIFLIFNSTVIYESGITRWVSVMGFALLGGLAAICHRRGELQ